jgi:hypothetical protein
LVDLVKERCVSSWQDAEDPPHLQTIRDRFDKVIESDEPLGTQMLGLYMRVLAATEGVELSRTRVEHALRLSGLVVSRDGRLQSTNPIYREAFGSDWVERILKRLRPYDEAFLAWMRSGREDSSRLLEGAALREGLTWAETRTPGPDERAFLKASQARVDARRSRLQVGTSVAAGVLLAASLLSLTLYLRSAQLYADLDLKSKEARANFKRAQDEAAEAKRQAQIADQQRARADEAAKDSAKLAAAATTSETKAKDEALRASAEKERANQAAAQANAQSKLAQKNAEERDAEARKAREEARRVQTQSEQLSVKLAECTTIDEQRARLRDEVDRLRKQCSNGASTAVDPKSTSPLR